MEHVTSVMKNILSSKNVVQMLIFALQMNIWKRNYKYYQYSTIILIQISTLKFFFVTQAFCFFNVRICFFGAKSGFIRNHWMGALHVTLNTDILAGNAARQWHYW